MQLKSIGKIHSKNGQFQLLVDPEYKAGLSQLENFGYIHVLWWANNVDSKEARNTLSTPLPYANNLEAGVFACRSPYRPNPVAISVCPVIHVDHEKGLVTVAYIDADHDTPLLDIKPYIPVSDKVRTVKVAPWFKTWPEFYEDAGEFFSKPENQFFD